jgi:hypothetical protein
LIVRDDVASEVDAVRRPLIALIALIALVTGVVYCRGDD